jgi:hypothetical protein
MPILDIWVDVKIGHLSQDGLETVAEQQRQRIRIQSIMPVTKINTDSIRSELHSAIDRALDLIQSSNSEELPYV